MKAKQDHVGMWAQGAAYEKPAAFWQRMRIQGDQGEQHLALVRGVGGLDRF